MAASIVVLPIDLKFSAAGPKRTFDIYNVHQYPVKYVIKTTAPEKFLINTTEGILSPHSAAKIEVTHVDISVVNEKVRDRFRIYFSLLKDKKYQPVGYRDVTAELVSHTDESSPRSGDTEPQHASAPASLSGGARSRHVCRRSSSQPPQQTTPENKTAGTNAQCQSMIYYLAPIVVLVAVLWLPTQGAVPNTPWYFELTVNSKITIGFVLGILVTLFYMRVQQADR
ncbi:motile sperm domain-containing protein 1-like [Littorina saxatilis]|uniref:MSP domain-containing protein n=1 Tax=Littorina saxatilis TaxID=31220 RepID=A0AAN9AN14_9CAEN